MNWSEWAERSQDTHDEPEYTEIEGIFQVATAKAICIKIDGDDTWIPISVCDSVNPEWVRNEPVVVDVQLWFAKKEGLDY